MRTQVGIVGAGPAGLLLSHLLARRGIDSVVLESRSRAHVEARVRAGVLEYPTVELLREVGLAARLDREGMAHEGISLRFDSRDHRIGLTWLDGHRVVPDGAPGAVRITGVLRDGAGAPVTDGLIETWQADPDGRFDHPDDPRGPSARPAGFTGFGRAATDAQGRYEIWTVPPGALGDGQAPHIDVSVFARGLLDRVVTRIYLPGNAAANAADPLLRALPRSAPPRSSRCAQARASSASTSHSRARVRRSS